MNAIILAAGMGTRMLPLTCDTPKPLVKVNGVPVIERQLQCLHSAGITEIYVVTGYHSGQFEYLKYRYGVNLIYNPLYAVYNNIYSLYLAREHFNDSYIIEGDIFIRNNVFTRNISWSCYFSGFKKRIENEWVLEYDDEQFVRRIFVPRSSEGLPAACRDGACIICGISHWTKEAAAIIRNAVMTEVERAGEDDSNIKRMFWDDMVIRHLHQLDLKINIVHSDDLFEIDTQNDLKELETYLYVTEEK